MTSSGKAVGITSGQSLPPPGLAGMDHNLASGSLPPALGTGLLHVAVIDSHSLTRECIAHIISYLFETANVFSCNSVLECSRSARQFGLIVLYLHAADCEPLELIRNLHSAQGDSTVFVISELDHQTNPEFIRAAWRLGVRGFVSSKTTGLTLALSAMRFVEAGGFFAPVDAMLQRMPAASERLSPPRLQAVAVGLTARETIVLDLLRDGKTNKSIARELGLSDNTVKVHVHNILRKMNVGSRKEAAATALSPVAKDPGVIRVM